MDLRAIYLNVYDTVPYLINGGKPLFLVLQP